MSSSNISATYSINGNQVTVTSSYPQSFSVAFMVICFLSPLTADNTPAELGNIETFLCNDSYYPYTSMGSRYSYIQHFKYIQNGTNCARIQNANSAQFTISGNTSPPWVAFLNNSGIVRGPKMGIIANNTNVAQYPIEYVRRVIQTVKDEWNSRKVSAGTIEAMIPDLLMHKTACVDEDIVFNVNRTLYDNLGPDPRNPSDPTRNKGLFPKCSSKDCFNGGFKSKFNGQNFKLHDHIFRVNLVLQLADIVLSKIQC